ncbi:hypothetical protein PILCRDRAFT_379983 [Piloderma croceum F 1598]|uniref:Uncharacterized protein n=1 Tax=Piloderma croceum (strain F 1598) TaxID=765440 RepID=A0A0C3FZ56_PILCF|nr:hypothetical protein PILCRDRAFT_379983 [Piloderma croceum F 1598]
MIFLRALPPSFLVDSSLNAGSDSPWCEALRMKKSIVWVCKAWWQVGLELLYEEISMRRIGQNSALLRTLNANNDIGHMIKNPRNILLYTCLLLVAIPYFCILPSRHSAQLHTPRIYIGCRNSVISYFISPVPT